jgi:DNA mismatch repair protein MutL
LHTSGFIVANSESRIILRAMSDVIKLLPDHVANQIAAGEVIQRPASVVKELLENSVDAGSTSIQLLIKEGGRALIQVIDNGKGMSPTDARMCWERHATSKISSAEDIFGVRTMGFRGEALASIASVAMVEMKTRRKGDEVATQIVIEGTEVKSQQAVAAPQGTSITVKNLFFNIPARRNFLKSDAVETRHIIDEFVRVALANPEIEMSLYNNDNEVYRLKSGDAAMRIHELFGYDVNEQLLSVNEATTIVNISGCVGKPDIAKRTRGEQYFFVNRRFIKDNYLNHALVSCYEQLISKEQFPFYVIYIEIDPAQIDINVHPTKTEIKFEDERSVYQIIKAVTKKALGEHYHIPTYEPMSQDGFLNFNTPAIQQTQQNYGERKFENASFAPNRTKPEDWKELFSVIEKKRETIGDIPVYTNRSDAPAESVQETTRNIVQIHNSVILSQIKSGLLVIDQQAAHERILYERYLHALSEAPIASQQKLFPKSIMLSSQDEALMKSMMPEIRKLGFDISELGKHTYAINGIPAELTHQNEQELIEDLLEAFKKSNSDDTEKHHKMAKALARKAAVKSGTRLTAEEMTTLIDELFACSTPYLSPDGKPCLKRLTLEEVFNLIKS